MRDRAVVWAALRELAPMLGLAVVIGGVVLSFEHGRDFGFGRSSRGLIGVPLAALWGGVALGGSSPAAALHLMVRPVGRLRLLALRVLALWLVLLVAGFLLLVAGGFFWSGGPSLAGIVLATVFATGVGAQAGVSTQRETVALGASLLLLAGHLGPVHLAIDAAGLSWDRVMVFAGVELVPAVAIVVIAVFAPVCVAWRRWWPRGGHRIMIRSLGLSLVAGGLGVPLGATPVLLAVAQPEHGELLAIVGQDDAGIWVATGTRGPGGDDLVDGVVAIALDGRRTTVWDRRASHADWRVESFEMEPGDVTRLKVGVSRGGKGDWIVLDRPVVRPRKYRPYPAWRFAGHHLRRSVVVSADLPQWIVVGQCARRVWNPTELECDDRDNEQP